jgi:hypothetical protein
LVAIARGRRNCRCLAAEAPCLRPPQLRVKTPLQGRILAFNRPPPLDQGMRHADLAFRLACRVEMSGAVTGAMLKMPIRGGR